MSLCAIVFVVLLVLKLTLYPDWSWWLVFAPLIAEVVLDVLFLVVGGSIMAAFDRRARRRVRNPGGRR